MSMSAPDARRPRLRDRWPWCRRPRALPAPASRATPPIPDEPSRVVRTHADLLWFKTSNDDEGRITLGLLPCPPDGIGVLVDDDGESLGLRLSREEAQD